jgi:hypothetical protein
MLGALLSWQLPLTMGKGLDWQAGQFLVSGWNILF